MGKKNKEVKIPSSKKKIEEGTKKKSLQTDWFFMTPHEVHAKDIAQHLKTETNVLIELWEEMNILQIELPNKVTVDFEPMEGFDDPSDLEFIRNRNIKTIFAVYISSGVIEGELLIIIKGICSRWNGILCADTNDFQPVFD